MLQAAAQQKTARITDAMALTIVCEECDVHCEDHYGSTMITTESETVTCPSCGATYAVPQHAFRVVCKAKCKEVRR
jgi:hypothetical protein